MDHIKRKGAVNYAFCKELLAKYQINLEREKELERLQHANQFKTGEGSQMDDSNDAGTDGGEEN